MKQKATNFIMGMIFSYIKNHKKEVATMLRDGLNMYLNAVPKRRRKKSKKTC